MPPPGGSVAVTVMLPATGPAQDTLFAQGRVAVRPSVTEQARGTLSEQGWGTAMQAGSGMGMDSPLAWILERGVLTEEG